MPPHRSMPARTAAVEDLDPSVPRCCCFISYQASEHRVIRFGTTPLVLSQMPSAAGVEQLRHAIGALVNHKPICKLVQPEVGGQHLVAMLAVMGRPSLCLVVCCCFVLP